MEGSLQPLLQARFGALTAALMVGLVWTVWHLPLFVVPDTPLAGVSPAVVLMAIFLFSVVLTALFLAGGAVGPVVLMHAQVNALFPWVPVPSQPL